MGKSQKKFTKAMVMAVGILGLFSTAMLLNDPPIANELEVTPLLFEINSAKLTQINQRGIASVEGGKEQNESAQSIIDFDCKKEEQNFETSQLRLRIKGGNCLGEETKSTSIKNSSNGFVATVFHKKDFSFTTDYINLSEGKNEIDVSFETSSGVLNKKKLVITRAPASIKK